MVHVSVSGTGGEGAEKLERKLYLLILLIETLAKDADGHPDTHAFVASPEMVAMVAVSHRLDFNPITDSLQRKW